MSIIRRVFLKHAVAGGAIIMGLGGSLLAPRHLLAARPDGAFEADSKGDAMGALFDSDPIESGDITIKAPDIAENGAVVPVTIETRIDGVESITIIVDNNPNPLVAAFTLTPNSGNTVSTRIKMGKTSPVHAVVQAGGKLYSASKEVKVTIGGCGG